MLLNDVPESSVMSWDMINMSDVPAANLPVLSEMMSDGSNLSLSSAGVGTNLTGFLRNRAVDLIGGQLLFPIFNWLDDVTGDPWTSRVIQGTLATMGLVIGGDPFGVIAAPICWGIQEYMRQRQRLVANNDPEADRGRKFGYVREGDKWYPAIQTSKERDEGWLGSNKTQVTFQYGNEIKWKKKKGSSEWMPYFEEGTYHMKNFHVWDNEVDKPEAEAGETYQKRVDPLRDFYYLSEEETTDYLTGISGGDTIMNAEDGQKDFTAEEQASINAAQGTAFGSFAVKDDQGWSDYWNEKYPDEAAVYSKRGAYVDQLQDIRKSLEFMQSYRYSDNGKLSSTDFGVNEFEGSREFRNKVNDNNYLGLPTWHSEHNVCNPNAGCVNVGHYYKDLSGRLEGQTAEELADAGKTNFQDSDEMLYLTDMYVQQRDMLFKTQKAAGTSMGFNEKFGKAVPGYIPTYYTDEEGVFTEPGDDTYRPFDENAFRGLKDNGWALYQDGTWLIGPTDTAQQLHDAIAKIEASGEEEYMGTPHYRNEDQRSYLAQKAYCRYLYSKINQLGGYDYFNGVQGTKTTIFEKTTARMKDKWRVQPQIDVGMGWGLDPMYSEIDDHALPKGSFGNDIIHRDDWVEPEYAGVKGMMGQDGNELRQLQEAGIIDDWGNNPDFVAGRFKNQDEWLHFTDSGALPYDEAAQQYIAPGEETPHTTYNPDTGTYQIDSGYYWDEGKETLVVPGEETEGYEWNPDTRRYEKPPEPVEPVALPTWDTDDESPDFDAGWGHDLGQDFDVPEGWYIDIDGNLYPTQEKQDELDAEAAAQQQREQDEADAAAAAAQQALDDKAKDDADAAAAAAQVVPDDTHGATHVHDEPYVPEHHEIMHFAADPTAPAHIPMGLIASQIEEGIKVI